MTDFSAILSKPVEEVERPKPLPAGTYVFMVSGHEFGESAKKKTPFVRFNVSPMAPEGDVDMNALSQVKEWNKKKMKIDFYLTDDALFRLREFCEHCGQNISGRTFQQLIPDLTNSTFKGNVIHEISDKDPNDVFASIGATTKA